MVDFTKHINEHNFEAFCKQLSHRLSNELPGEAAHLRMTSKVRLTELKFSSDRSNAKLSSVLILLYLNKNSIYTSFILRPQYDGVHSGQVAFPGGKKEDEDTSPIETAIREAHEEVNIYPNNIKILGTLTDLYIPPSNYLVTPVVACTTIRPDFIPQESEVEEIIESNISFLFDPNLKKRKTLNIRNSKIEAPYYQVNGKIVWGATAMILSELEELISSFTKS